MFTLRLPKLLLVMLAGALAAPTGPAAAGTPVDFTVFGNVAWQDTGVDVTAGDVLQMTATGAIRFKSPNQTTGPDGLSQPPTFDFDALLPSAHVLSLIGRIDATSVPEGSPGFGAGYVGSSYEQIVTTRGRLYLAYDDSLFSDNTVSFNVQIATYPSLPVSTPAGLVLLAATLALVARNPKTGTILSGLLRR